MANYLLPIEKILRSHLIPAITGDNICSEAKKSVTCTSSEIRQRRITEPL